MELLTQKELCFQADKHHINNIANPKDDDLLKEISPFINYRIDLAFCYENPLMFFILFFLLLIIAVFFTSIFLLSYGFVFAVFLLLKINFPRYFYMKLLYFNAENENFQKLKEICHAHQ